MTADELIRHYPRLYHMADHGAWPSIRTHGLLSTSALLSAHGVVGEARAALEARRRPTGVALDGAGLPSATLRDQGPMSDAALCRCLDDGLSPEDWYRRLNARVFFWLSRERLLRLLNARAYRTRPQIVLTLDTESLVAAHGDAMELSPINSGATIFGGPRRGLATFVALADYPFAALRARRGIADAVVELTIPDRVADAHRHTLLVEAIDGGTATDLWRQGDGASTA